MIAAGLLTVNVAAWVGIAAPILLGVYLAWAARARRGYDPVRDTISALGDGVDRVAGLFLVVNIVIGVMLTIFGLSAVRPALSEGFLPTLVVMAGVGSVLIGFTAGDKHCRLPGVYGRPFRRVHAVHLAIGFALLGIMQTLPMLTAIDEGLADEHGQLRAVSAAIGVLYALTGLTAGVAAVQGYRQLLARRMLRPPPRWRSKLLRAPPMEQPWLDPRRWMDRWGLYERMIWAVGYTWLIAAATSVLADRWCAVSAGAFLLLAMVVIWWPKRAVPLLRYTVESGQENIVYGVSGATCGELGLYTIKDPIEFRASIRDLLEQQLLRAEHPRTRKVQSPAREFTVTFGVTHEGLKALDERYEWHGPRDDVYATGMWDRRRVLGDRSEHWDAGWHGVHVGLWAYARTPTGLADAVKVMARVRGASLVRSVLARVANDRDSDLLRVKDGISQPWVLGVPAPSKRPKQKGPDEREPDEKGPDKKDPDPRGGGKLSPGGRWVPLALGEFVLGQVDEANDVFPVPDPAPLFLGASFAATMQLEVSDARLPHLLDRLVGEPAASAVDDPQAAERAAALALSKLVGRDSEGLPLASPSDGDNRFTYGNDPFGLGCPVGAHIRRANPRDSLGFDGVLVNRRRMIRRGMGYATEPAGRDGPLAGLLFVGIVARVQEQFEFVQEKWLNDGAAFGLGRDPDVVSGLWTDGRRQVVIPGPGPPSLAWMEEPIVELRGGAYFLVPSVRGLHYLARE